jgi:hypothetical protein
MVWHTFSPLLDLSASFNDMQGIKICAINIDRYNYLHGTGQFNAVIAQQDHLIGYERLLE